MRVCQFRHDRIFYLSDRSSEKGENYRRELETTTYEKPHNTKVFEGKSLTSALEPEPCASANSATTACFVDALFCSNEIYNIMHLQKSQQKIHTRSSSSKVVKHINPPNKIPGFFPAFPPAAGPAAWAA
ncbi:hypothetical protein NYE76_01415 [Paenibacillus sp. FSL M7-0831]